MTNVCKLSEIYLFIYLFSFQLVFYWYICNQTYVGHNSNDVRQIVNDHSDSKKGNPVQPLHGLLFPISTILLT